MNIGSETYKEAPEIRENRRELFRTGLAPLSIEQYNRMSVGSVTTNVPYGLHRWALCCAVHRVNSSFLASIAFLHREAAAGGVIACVAMRSPVSDVPLIAFCRVGWDGN